MLSFQNSFHARRARRPLRFSTLALATGLLTPLLLSGCGGGGGGSTNTSEGFRFVPEGSGEVIPYANVDFHYAAGSVSSGIIVTATPVATSSLPAPPDSNAVPLSAYQISLSSSATFTPPATISLTYDSAHLPSGFTVPGLVTDPPRIYVYQSGKWSILPSAPSTLTAATLTTGTGTAPVVLGGTVPSPLSRSSIIAVFAETVPIPPTNVPAL